MGGVKGIAGAKQLIKEDKYICLKKLMMTFRQPWMIYIDSYEGACYVRARACVCGDDVSSQDVMMKTRNTRPALSDAN